MSFLSDIKAIKDISNLKNGGTATLSYSQITDFIINLSDAKKKLSQSQYEAIYSLYKEMRKCKTKFVMDMNEYLNACVKIINKFDAIAPYEKYSGGNEIEYSFLMDELRKEKNTVPTNTDLDEDEKQYIKYIIEKSSGIINNADAINFIKVLQCYHQYGKTKAIYQFNSMLKEIIKEKPMTNSLASISFLSGLLEANGILTESESNSLIEKYTTFLFKLNNIKG